MADTAVTCLQRMAGNNAWSNLRLHRAVGELDAAEYGAERTSFFPSIRETLEHILLVDLLYLDALERTGRGRAVLDDPPPATFAELRAQQRASDLRLLALTNRLDAEGLEATIGIDRETHTQTERVIDTLLHLFEHQIHHRGQAHAMLAGTRVRPPQLDEFFMAEELPLREAELRELGLPLR